MPANIFVVEAEVQIIVEWKAKKQKCNGGKCLMLPTPLGVFSKMPTWNIRYII